jgi:hypothetical protein
VEGPGAAPQATPSAKTKEKPDNASGRPRWYGIIWAALAIVLYLAIADAAVETLLRDSPLRWWIAGAAALYLVLCAGVWRLMPKLWRRLNWVDQAGLSLVVLLALMSVTAWMPGGLDQGLNLLGQPTAIVLALVSAAVVALSGIFLARLPFVPLSGKIVAGFLTAYAVAAFLLAVFAGTPYPSLFHGASQWTRLPSWMQGATVGGLFLVPLALLLEIVTGLRQITRDKISDFAFKVVALGMSLVITVAGFKTIPESVIAPYPEAAAPFSSEMAAGSSLSDPDPELKNALEMLHRFQAKANSESYDVSAAAQMIGNDAQKILTTLSNDFSFDPYRGSLRGAQGTLMSKGGNAMDLSRLLCALLSVHGYQVRMVHGQLSDEDGQRLLNRAKQQPRVSPAPEVSLNDVAEVSGLPVDEVRRRLETADTKGREMAGILQERVQRDTASIERLLHNSQVRMQAAPGPTLDDVRTHFWVQAEIDGVWRELDPSFPDAKLGQHFAEAAGETPVDSVPDEWMHTMRLRVLTNYEGGGEGQDEALSVRLRVPDLVGKSIMLGFAAVDGQSPSPETTNAFRPVLVVGTQQTTGSTIYLDAARAAAKGPGGLFGSALSGGEPQPLNSVTLEITLEGPGHAPAQVTRTVVAAPESPAADASARIEQAREQLVTVYQFVVVGGALPPEWLASSYVSFLEQFERPSIDTMEVIPLDLLNFAMAATRPEVAEQAGHPGGMRRYFKQPLVVGQRLSLRKGPANRIALVKSLDILFNKSEILSRDPLDAVRQGVLETNLERLIMEGMEVANTTVVFERSRASTLILEPGRPNTLAQLNFSAEAKRRITEDLTAGYIVIVPTEAVEIGGTSSIGWWRILPQNGETLGRMGSGEGQAMTEYIAQIPGAYATAASFLCPKFGKATGICNPCLILLAGFIGMTVSLYLWAIGEKAGSVLSAALGITGFAKNLCKCLRSIPTSLPKSTEFCT